VKALQVTGWNHDPQLVEVARPEPGPGQVVVKVGGAGVCHSDLHILYEMGDVAPWPLPFTLGHENAGWVDQLGPGARGFEVGQAVAVYGAYGCGACDRCRAGASNYCEDPLNAPVPGGGCGLGGDGGMAEYVLVPAVEYLVALPDGLTPAQAAPLTDAGLTPYHAIRRSAHKLGPTATAVVIGVGGLGHVAVQILKATTPARVVVVDTKAESLELGLACGADEALDAGDRAAAEIRRATGGRGADVVLDFVGADATLALAAASTRTLGDLTVVGIAGGTLPFNFFGVPYEASVQSVYWGSRPELVEILALGARGLLRPQVTTWPLAEAPAAYQALKDGKVKGRAVVIPNPPP
jgi:propanol-preferring alcohol dehydrogenase